MTPSGRIAFTALEQVIYGHPAAAEVAAVAARLGSERVFLMVSGTLRRETEEIDRITDALGKRQAGTFDRMPAHSPRSAVIAAANAAREAGADLVVTVGGGSLTDAGKAVQLCLANGIDSVEAIDRLVIGPDNPVEAIEPPAIRQVSVPTTLSAGEFSAISGVTNETTSFKERLQHPMVVPHTVILDPSITRHTPEWLWLSTGIRAVDHCSEGLASANANPFGDAQAAKGLELLARGLNGVKADPDNVSARLDCQLGAWMSMGPLSSGVPMGASHGIGYVLGAAHGVPHGHTSCVMLPYVMRWNASVNADRQAMISAALGRPGDAAGDVLHDLIAGLGLPRTLGDVGVGDEHIDEIAETALKTNWMPYNPRKVERADDIREILRMAVG